MRTWLTIVASASLLVSVVACGGDGDAAAAKDPGSGDAASVDIKTFRFAPGELRVQAGSKVTWTNADSILHTVTSGTRKADAMGQPTDVTKDGQFDLQLSGKGSTGSFTFDEAGSFTYFCDIHPGMDASVVVS